MINSTNLRLERPSRAPVHHGGLAVVGEGVAAVLHQRTHVVLGAVRVDLEALELQKVELQTCFGVVVGVVIVLFS